MSNAEILGQLWDVIEERRTNPREGSYTCKLLDMGTPEIAKKLGEEAIEVIVAMSAKDPRAVVYEAADLIYHLWVALSHSEVTPEDVYAELRARYCRGGHPDLCQQE
jgi:phosphoribosyl-ATP pyrophosphohydrolase